MLRLTDGAVFIRRGDGERYFLSSDRRHGGSRFDRLSHGGGRGMKPPTVVCFGGRQGARAATAASSIRADKTGVARTCREPLLTARAVSFSVTVRLAVPAVPVFIFIGVSPLLMDLL